MTALSLTYILPCVAAPPCDIENARKEEKTLEEELVNRKLMVAAVACCL